MKKILTAIMLLALYTAGAQTITVRTIKDWPQWPYNYTLDDSAYFNISSDSTGGHGHNKTYRVALTQMATWLASHGYSTNLYNSNGTITGTRKVTVTGNVLLDNSQGGLAVKDSFATDGTHYYRGAGAYLQGIIDGVIYGKPIYSDSAIGVLGYLPGYHVRATKNYLELHTPTNYYAFTDSNIDMGGDWAISNAVGTAGQVLTMDSHNVARWQDASGGGPWLSSTNRIYQADTTQRVAIGTVRPKYNLHVVGSTFLSKELPGGKYMELIIDTNIKGYPINALSAQYGTPDGAKSVFWDLADYRGIGQGDFHFDMGYADRISGRTFILEGDSTFMRTFAQDYNGGASLSTYFTPTGVGIGTATPQATLDLKGAIHSSGRDSLYCANGREWAYIGHTNISNTNEFSPTIAYVPDTAHPLDRFKIKMGANIADWNDSMVVDIRGIYKNHIIWDSYQTGNGVVERQVGSTTFGGTIIYQDSTCVYIGAGENDTVLSVDAVNRKVQIGSVATPASLQLIDGTQGDGKVLLSDADGNASWVDVQYILSLVPAYANNTAATSGGLASGNTYYNTTSNTYTRVP